MEYGICNLGMVPMRTTPEDSAELCSQILFGEHFKVLDRRKKWSRIRLAHDKYEGWIDNKQYLSLSENEYNTLENSPIYLSENLVDYVSKENQHELMCITSGSRLPLLNNKSLCIGSEKYLFEGAVINNNVVTKAKIISTAFMFLNAPYMWGGRSALGIDCSGFTQLVYKLNGYQLKRDASQQATQGEVLSFIEESSPGDLAFFDNEEGRITHVGIIMEDNYIIHAHGKVRIDRLDHTGIYNVDNKRHSHKLRVIKKII